MPPSCPPVNFRPTVVRDLDGAFNWARDYFKVIHELMPPGILLDLKSKIENTDRSTAYSGIDAMGVADGTLCHVLGQLLGQPVRPMAFRAATECDLPCQAELLRMPVPPEHIFDDVKAFLRPSVLKDLQFMSTTGVQPPLQAFVPLVKSGKAVVDYAPCRVHGRVCKHPRTKMHQGSPACTDFSSMGSQEGTDGPTMAEFAAWAALRILLAEPFTLLEESDRFEESTLSMFFEDTHIIMSKKINSLDVGFPANRARFWCVMLHRRHVQDVYTSLDNVVPFFTRLCHCTWHEFLIANSNDCLQVELDDEVKAAGARKSSRAFKTKPVDILALSPSDRYMAVLTPNEEKWVKGYTLMKPGCCCMTNQNPASGHGIWTRDFYMFSILRNPCFHFSTFHHRWLSASEVLLVNGFPVLARLADPKGMPARLTSYCRDDHGLFTSVQLAAGRNRNYTVAQAGNTMLPAIAGILELYALLWCRLKDESKVARMCRFLRPSGSNDASFPDPINKVDRSRPTI